MVGHYKKKSDSLIGGRKEYVLRTSSSCQIIILQRYLLMKLYGEIDTNVIAMWEAFTAPYIYGCKITL